MLLSCQAGDGLTKPQTARRFWRRVVKLQLAARTSPTRQTPLTKQVVSTSDS